MKHTLRLINTYYTDKFNMQYEWFIWKWNIPSDYIALLGWFFGIITLIMPIWWWNMAWFCIFKYIFKYLGLILNIIFLDNQKLLSVTTRLTQIKKLFLKTISKLN